MIRTFGTNEQNDIYIGSDGNLAVLTGINAVAGACETATKAQLGEMIYATTQGMPALQVILGVGVPNYPIYETALRNTILGVQDVSGIEGIQLQPTGNELDYTVTINTIYGPVQLGNSGQGA